MANPIWNIDGKEVISTGGAIVEWEDDTFFLVSYGGHTYQGEVVEEDLEGNCLTLKINHRIFTIKKKGPLDALITAMGLDKPKVRQLRELEAPMPGRIVNVAVEIGQELSVGDEILSLEAMKMENVLKAEGVGIVKKICITTDDIVEKGAVLIEFE